MQLRPSALDTEGVNAETCEYMNFRHRFTRLAQGKTMKLFRSNSNHDNNNNACMGKYEARNSLGFMSEQWTLNTSFL